MGVNKYPKTRTRFRFESVYADFYPKTIQEC